MFNRSKPARPYHTNTRHLGGVVNQPIHPNLPIKSLISCRGNLDVLAYHVHVLIANLGVFVPVGYAVVHGDSLEEPP